MGVKYPVNEKFFVKWGPEMAYVLGYIYADGSLEDASYLRGKYLRVTSTDRKSIVRIRRWMNSEHTIVVQKPSVKHPGKIRYCLRIGSHKLYNNLMIYGLRPRKSLTIQFPEIPPPFLSHYVRGYLDGDGCIYLERGTGSKKQRILKRLSVIFTSGSPGYLKGLEEALRKRLRLSERRIYSSARAFQLRFSTRDSLKICDFLYKGMRKGQYLERKFAVYQHYLELKNGAVVK
ncbi:MAG: hypothetical protein IT405_02755 [Candidatus Yanofskybacteria bacterium]|nr:hypothetical protein [Candidatus Yanofskybacteria bacterium]